jgi:hypothetical protein
MEINMSKRLNPTAIGPDGLHWTPEEAAELSGPAPGFTCPRCGQILKLMVSRDNHPRALGFPRWEHQAYDAETCQSIRRREARIEAEESWESRAKMRVQLFPAGNPEDPE